MMYNKNLIINQFDNACDMCKQGWQAGLWPSWSVQQKVFKAMLDFGQGGTNHTILDVGCGQGDLVDYISDYCLDYKYTGIDISPRMIEKAKERHPQENFLLQDVMDHEGAYDYVIATGTFNIKVSEDTNLQMGYTRAHLEKLFSLSRRAVSVFFLSKLLWDSYYEGLHYHDPIAVIKECADISKLFTVDHCNLPGLILVRIFRH